MLLYVSTLFVLLLNLRFNANLLNIGQTGTGIQNSGWVSNVLIPGNTHENMETLAITSQNAQHAQ